MARHPAFRSRYAADANLLSLRKSAATDRGIDSLRASVLTENRRMLGLLARHTEIVSRQVRDSVTELVFRRRRVPAFSTSPQPS